MKMERFTVGVKYRSYHWILSWDFHRILLSKALSLSLYLSLSLSLSLSLFVSLSLRLSLSLCAAFLIPSPSCPAADLTHLEYRKFSHPVVKLNFCSIIRISIEVLFFLLLKSFLVQFFPDRIPKEKKIQIRSNWNAVEIIFFIFFLFSSFFEIFIKMRLLSRCHGESRRVYLTFFDGSFKHNFLNVNKSKWCQV